MQAGNFFPKFQNLSHGCSTIEDTEKNKNEKKKFFWPFWSPYRPLKFRKTGFSPKNHRAQL